jgi:hypothetical protein
VPPRPILGRGQQIIRVQPDVGRRFNHKSRKKYIYQDFSCPFFLPLKIWILDLTWISFSMRDSHGPDVQYMLAITWYAIIYIFQALDGNRKSNFAQLIRIVFLDV